MSAPAPGASRPALEAVRARRSWSKVSEMAPGRAELLDLVAAAGRVADHSSLRPWRLIELRGDDRTVLGAAIADAQGDHEPSAKPLRAPLLIAVVASYKKSEKVPRWEQEAVASGVAHTLSLLLDEAGWGVIWRTGHYTRSAAVAKAHGLADDEDLLGWLYVGGKPDRDRPERRSTVDAAAFLGRMPGTGTVPGELAHWRAANATPKKNGGSKKKNERAAEKAREKKPTDWAAKAAKAEKKARKAAKKAASARAKADDQRTEEHAAGEA